MSTKIIIIKCIQLFTFRAYLVVGQHPPLLGPCSSLARASALLLVAPGAGAGGEGLAVERNPHDQLGLGGPLGEVVLHHGVLTQSIELMISSLLVTIHQIKWWFVLEV